MGKLSNYLKADFGKYGLEYKKREFIKCLFGRSIALKFICLFRLTRSCKSEVSRKIVRQFLMSVERRYGLEIPDTVEIGEGLYIGHPYGITINPGVKMGNNIAIHKGVTLGRENRGKREGAPVVGDNVWFGINSTVVGRIKIGNDVLIAPNAYINMDVPAHSIVVGNPCKVIRAENATEGYLI